MEPQDFDDAAPVGVDEDAAEPKKRGRKPIEITEQMISQAETLAAQGMTTEQIAQALGLGVSTLYEKFEQYPELSDAIKKGKAIGIAMVTEKLLEKAMTMDTTAMIFYLKCQAGWREPQHIQMTGADGTPLIPSVNIRFVGTQPEVEGNGGG